MCWLYGTPQTRAYASSCLMSESSGKPNASRENGRKAMTGLQDMLRSAAPGGNIGKPLMLALGALLASGALFRTSGA